LIDSDVSLLLNLGAAQQGRSMLFSDEQKLLFEGWKKGFVMDTKLEFHETLTKPRMKATSPSLRKEVHGDYN
jgi:hypothetical protein